MLPTKRAPLGATALLCLLPCLAFAQDESTEPVAEPVVEPAAEPAPEPAPAPVETIPVAEIAPPQAPPAAPADPEVTQLDDMVVTATKREKSIRDVPASISAFDGDMLENQGNLGLTDYLQKKPGITITEISPGLVRMSVRGISTDASPLSPLPSATGVFIGDTAFSDAYISNIQPDLSAFDLQTVEVLKGPQGTLFGGTALAGAVRYVLNKPEMGLWQARGFTQYVDAEEGGWALTSGAALNAPLYENSLAARIGYVKREYPGVTDVVREERTEDVDSGRGEQMRGILAWQPMDALKFELTHLQQDYATDAAVTTAADRQNRENPRVILPIVTDSNFALDSLEVGYDFDAWRIVSLSSLIEKNWYVYSDATSAVAGPPENGYPPALGAFTQILDYIDAFSQEVRVQSVGTDFQWMVGAYYYQLDLLFEIFIDTIAHQVANGSTGYPGDVNTTPTSNQTSLLYAITNNRATEKAVFVDLGYTFFDDLELSAGARFYETRVRGGFFGTGALAKGVNNGQDVNYADNDLQEDGINPKFTATWHVTDAFATYFQAAKGYRFGGLQSVPSTPGNNVPVSYNSDSLWNYEVGLRTSWLSNTLQFDPTLFYIAYDNPQIVQTTTGIPINYTDNVGAAVSKGGEVTMRWLTPLPGLTLSAAGGLTDSRTVVPFTAAGGVEIPAGAYLPGSARSQYSVAADFLAFIHLPVSVATHVDYSYIGKAFADIQNDVPVNDYATLNAGLIFSNNTWMLRPKLAINVANILNETSATYGTISKPLTNSADGQTYESYILNPPRMVSARLALEF